jgi:uncharacterized membrane protein HdeD (DUF308 family)
MIALSLFVVAIGAWFLISALANWDWYKGIVDFAATEAILGENAARWLCGLVGIVAIVFGIAMLFQR